MPAVNIPEIGVVNFPDTMSIPEINRAIREEVIPNFRRQQGAAQTEPTGPQLLPVPERGFFGTVGARAGDVAGSLVSGAGGIASGVGGLAGMAGAGFDNPLSRAGRGIREFGEGLMSPELQNKKTAFAQALSQAEGQGFVTEAATAARELASNPGLLASMAIEQIPQFLASFGIGRGALAVGQRVGGTAEAGRRAAVGAAIGTAAGLQGGDIAGQTYEDVLKLPVETMEQSPAYRELLATMSPQEARESLATRAGREAGLMAGGLSAATTAILPGVERAAFSKNLSRSAITRALGIGTGEAVGEAIEEGGGRAAQNLAASRADTERDLMRGVGGAAATGAILGGTMGAGVGAISAPPVDPEEARRSELRGAIEDVVGARQPEPEATPAPAPQPDRSPERISQLLEISKERLASLNESIRDADIRLIEATVGSDVDTGEVAAINAEIRELNKQARIQRNSITKLSKILPTLRPTPAAAAPVTPPVEPVAPPAVPVEPVAVSPVEPTAAAPAPPTVEPAPEAQPEVAPAPAPPVAAEATPPTPAGPRVTGFTTAQGSTYQVNDQGQTIRTKRSPGRGQGTTYDPYNALYVDPAEADSILEELRDGGNYRFVVEDGGRPRVIEAGESLAGRKSALALFSRTGEFVRYVPAQMQPAVGLSPVELLYASDPDGNRVAKKHIGNPIVSLETADTTPQTAEQGRAPELSARRVGGQPQAATEAETEQADTGTDQSLAVIQRYLTDLRGKGQQGQSLANAMEEALADRRFNATQIYSAFTIDNAILKSMPKGADYKFKFVDDLVADDADAARASGANVGDRIQGRTRPATESIPAFIEISLAEDMLPILNETAAHEAFHVLQNYFGAYDKGFNALLAKSFKKDMTIDQLEPSIKRRLQGLKAPGLDKSYFDVLKEGIGDNPLSVREAQAYAFGALTDAAMRGQKVTGLTAPFQRFANFLRDTFSRLRSGLRGDGYQTAADLLAGAGARAEGFIQAAPTEGGTEYSARDTPAQTQTENFKKWFKDSKVVDAEGEPLVVYHGTGSDITEFDVDNTRMRSGKLGRGIYMTPLPNKASFFAKIRAKDGAPNVMPLFTRIERPFEIQGEDNIPVNGIDRKTLKVNGYDGIILRNDAGEMSEIVAFNPEQIKSATGNRGTFSESEKRIDYSARRAPGSAARANSPQKPSAPTGTAKSFYQTVIKDVDNSSVLDRILTVMLDKKGGESIGSAIARTSINQAAPLYNLDKMARAEGYKGMDASKALEISMSNSGRIAQMLSTGMGKIDPKTGAITRRNDVKPLLQIMKEAGVAKDENKVKGLQAYLAALRERDLRAAGRKGFTNETIQAVNATIKESETQNPQWKKTAAELDKLNQALVDWAMATGLITKQQARALMDKFYTPFYREDYEYVTNAIGRQSKGGEKALNDLFGNIILNADSIMKAGLKNLATKTAIETMEFVKLAKPNTSDKKNDNTISFKVNGKPTNYDVEDAVLFSALSVMPRQMQQGIYQTMANVASFFRDMVTAAPSFILASLYTGKISAFVQQGQPLNTNTIAGVRDALNNTTALQNFQLQTGFGGLEFGMGARNMAEAFKRKLNDEGIMKSLAKRKIFSAIREGFGKFQELSEATEMAERIKMAERLIKNGMKPQDAYFEAYMLAPYTRKGTGEGWLGNTVQVMMPLIPFLNAKIQTTYRLIENEKGDKRPLWALGLPQQIFLRGLVVTAFSVMAYAANILDDEEEWDKIPNHMKLGYDMIPIAGNYISLPRAHEVGRIFGAIPVFALDAARRGEGKDFVEALIEVAKGTLFFSVVPKAVDPIIGAVTNYNFFRGLPLETKSDERLPVQERINRSTTQTGQLLSSVVNTVLGDVLSPIKAQALLDNYTGTLGVTIMAGFDSLLAAAGAIPGKPAGAFGDPATMPAMLANAAGLNRFYREGDMMVSRFVGDFYKIKEMTDQLVRSENLARQANDFERLQELRGEEGLPLRIRSSVNAASEQISEINKRIRMIERQDTDGVAKAQAIQPLIDRRDRIAKRVVDQARNIGAF